MADLKALMGGILTLYVLSSKGYDLKCLLKKAQISRIFELDEAASPVGLP